MLRIERVGGMLMRALVRGSRVLAWYWVGGEVPKAKRGK
jgi:hypothetical protein